MATRGKKPGKDIADLKARLGLNKRLSQKKEAPPAPEPVAPSQPQAVPPPRAVAPRVAGQPPAGPPPQRRPASPPFGGPPGPPPHVHAARPATRPAPAPAPKAAEKVAWNAPEIDVNAGLDVPIVAHKNPFQAYGPWGAAILVGLIFGVIGYLMGGANQQRDLYNAQSRDAERILDIVKPKVDKIHAFKAMVDNHKADKPDPKLMTALQNGDYLVDPETLGAQHILLGPVITSDLLAFTSDTKLLFNTIRMHTFMTNKSDKKELEELIKATETVKADGFAIRFDSKSYVKAYDAKGTFSSPQGRLVVFDNQDPIDKNGEKYVKVRYPSNGKEVEVSMRSLIIISKDELLKSNGTNALRRYQVRHKQIQAQLKRMSLYMGKLLSGLEQLSERGDAPVLALENQTPVGE